MNIKLSLFNFKKSGSSPKESKLFLSVIPGFKEKRAKQFTALSLTLVTIAFFGIFAISPTLGTIAELQKQLDDSTFTHDSLQKKIANLTTLQQQYSEIADSLTPIYDAIPTSSTIDIFVGQLHTLAGLSNIQLTRVQTFPVDISQQTILAKYTSFEFSVEAQGSYQNLLQYITAITTFNRLTNFETINISHIGKIDSTFTMQIRGKTYFKPSL